MPLRRISVIPAQETTSNGRSSIGRNKEKNREVEVRGRREPWFLLEWQIMTNNGGKDEGGGGNIPVCSTGRIRMGNIPSIQYMVASWNAEMLSLGAFLIEASHMQTPSALPHIWEAVSTCEGDSTKKKCELSALYILKGHFCRKGVGRHRGRNTVHWFCKQ